jgi:membrane-bound inhibitor of C-type lysozyme
VRTFVVLVDVRGAHPNLMPDLSASLDVTLAQTPAAIVVPRDALRYEGDKAFVRVQRGSGFDDRAVTVTALNAHEAMLGSGLEEGAVIARNVISAAGRAR